jgi:DNA-binding NtrC family response regulator
MEKHIVVVDDDADIREALSMMLESEGYNVHAVGRADEAMKVLKNWDEPPNLILLDVLLSGADGRDIAKLIKRDQLTKEIPVVMMSAHPNVHESVKQCGADDFIEKPFPVDRLLEKVKRHVH